MTQLTIESVPIGAEVMFDGKTIGTTPLIHTIDEAVGLAEFRAECLSGGNVVCSWDVLKMRLEDLTISRLWWDLTRDERYSIARRVESGAFGYMIDEVCCGIPNCGGPTEEWKNAVCTQNGAIRAIKFASKYIPFADSCYYKNKLGGIECWLPEYQYHLPSAVVTCSTSGIGYGHTMCSIQIDEDASKLDNWIVFDAQYFDITPGHSRMPNYLYDDLWVKMEEVTSVSSTCGGYGGDEIATWYI